jgi:hypothetical protein
MKSGSPALVVSDVMRRFVGSLRLIYEAAVLVPS